LPVAAVTGSDAKSPSKPIEMRMSDALWTRGGLTGGWYPRLRSPCNPCRKLRLN
jgi:hypothetical protein